MAGVEEEELIQISYHSGIVLVFQVAEWFFSNSLKEYKSKGERAKNVADRSNIIKSN